MKKLILLAVLLSGCANMSEREKQTVWIVAGAIVVTAIATSNSGGSVNPAGCVESIIVGPDGSDRVCR